MKIRYFCWAVALLLVWVFAAHKPGTYQHDLQSTSLESRQGVSRIGSRPPKCEHKCGGCEPCIAIQVPTTQIANYQPEAWKCNCQTAPNP